MKLIVQPGDGIGPLIDGIKRAKNRIEIAIFRFDRREIEKALANAANRGVLVHALIAYTNRGGEEGLRALEMRLLAAGVTVARSGDDLVRYHDKYMIVDRKELHLLAFNFTYLDIERSRSFGVITTNAKLVQEAVKLFEADVKRQPYTPGLASFIVSPVNARRRLGAFLRGAKKELLIYDPEVSDPEMIRVLEQRARAGVSIRIIGRGPASGSFRVKKLAQGRLHTRTIIRDGRHAFIGSQSLRQIELDARRELGIVIRDAKVLSRLMKTFEEDWAIPERMAQTAKGGSAPVEHVAKKVARTVVKALPPVAPMMEVAMKEVAKESGEAELDREEVEEAVKEAVTSAVKEVVEGLVSDMVTTGTK